MKKPITKPGKFGTLYLYRVHFKDLTDAGRPLHMCVSRFYAYDSIHARERFFDTYTDEMEARAFEITEIERIAKHE